MAQKAQRCCFVPPVAQHNECEFHT